MADTVLITGSSRGLGKSLALTYAKNGYDVVIHGRDAEKLSQTDGEIRKLGVDCFVVQGDLSYDSTIKELVEEAQKRDISVLVNNAANDHVGKLEDMTPDQISEIMQINLMAPIMLTRGLYGHLKNRGSGTIVNINSISGREVHREKTLYCASKHGLKGFTDALKKEARRDGLAVIGVYPAGMDTEMYGRAGKDRSRGMNPDEVAELIFRSCQVEDTACASDVVIERRRLL